MIRTTLRTVTTALLLSLLPLHRAMSAQFSLRYMHEQSLSLESSYYAINGHPGGKPKFMGTHGYIMELAMPSRISLAQSYMQGAKSGSLQGFYTEITRHELGAELSFRTPLVGPLLFRPFAHLGWVRSELTLDGITQISDSARLAAGAGLLLHKHNRRTRMLAELEVRVALEAPIPSRFEPAGRWSGNLLSFGISTGFGGGTPWPTEHEGTSSRTPEYPETISGTVDNHK